MSGVKIQNLDLNAPLMLVKNSNATNKNIFSMNSY